MCTFRKALIVLLFLFVPVCLVAVKSQTSSDSMLDTVSVRKLFGIHVAVLTDLSKGPYIGGCNYPH